MPHVGIDFLKLRQMIKPNTEIERRPLACLAIRFRRQGI